MKKAVGGKTRVDLAVDQIIQVILDRDMKAGDKLPNEYDLARELRDRCARRNARADRPDAGILR